MKFSYNFPEIVQLVLKSLKCKFHNDVCSMYKLPSRVLFKLNVVFFVFTKVDGVNVDPVHFLGVFFTFERRIQNLVKYLR